MQRRSSASVKVFYPRFNREELLAIIRERLPSLQDKLDLLKVILYGSYAEGRYTVASDIDLLVVYLGEPRKDAYALVRRMLDIRGLEPHVYSEGQYELVRETVDRMTANGIPIVK